MLVVLYSNKSNFQALASIDEVDSHPTVMSSHRLFGCLSANPCARTSDIGTNVPVHEVYRPEAIRYDPSLLSPVFHALIRS